MWTSLFATSRRNCGIAAAAFATALLCASTALADGGPTAIDTGDTAWMLTSTALVLLMTLPGLALFYGGLVRAKNVLNVFMQCFVAAGAIGLIWIAVGYSLAFSGPGDFVGNLDKAFMNGITPDSIWANTMTPPRGIPEYVFVMFQAMFAIITPALILGAVAERMKFSAFLAFISLWLIFVYCPLAYMVWGGGWIFKAGGIDFAGGMVVHMSSGTSALIAALMVGKRKGFGREPMPPHSVPLCLIGAGLLWVGWFGFNAGSALSASGLAALAFLNTSTATSAAVMTWVGIEWILRGKPTALGAATAAVAGLVAITPACGNVSPMGSIAVGFGVSVICYCAVTYLKPVGGYDDSLDAFGVHGVGGAWGALASGLFCATYGTPAEGSITSHAQQVLIQLKGIGFTAVFAPAMSFAILLVLRFAFGSLRVSEEEEFEGLDLSAHSESAYSIGGGATLGGHGGHGAEGAAELAPAHH